MAISNLDKNGSIGKVRPKPVRVGLGVNVMREVGNSEYGPSLEELFLKRVRQDRTVVGRGRWVKRRIFFLTGRADSMLIISSAAIYGVLHYGARCFTCDTPLFPLNGFAM